MAGARGVVINGPETVTSRDQAKTVGDVVGYFRSYLSGTASQEDKITLNREAHAQWLKAGLTQGLSQGFSGLDASRPWFVFWITHALEMLEEYDESDLGPKVGSFLAQCQDPTGGFGGGPMQLPHLAPTYAAVSAIILSGCKETYARVDRPNLYKFLMRLKAPDGGFMVHDEGESDMRGCYCAIAVASMLHMLTDELLQGVPEFIRRCQTYEGGIAGEPGLEAHGGYAYCGLATLLIAGKADALDLDQFLHWLTHRQMALEGGFQGRTNKLVDSCYSFWQGAIFPLLHEAFRQSGRGDELPTRDYQWYDPNPLQAYVLLACQNDRGGQRAGGLRDKPGKPPDYYHTCYSLSGLSIAQGRFDGPPEVFGDAGNLLKRTDPLYNVLIEKAERKCAYFESLPPLVVDGRELAAAEGRGAVEARRRMMFS